MYTFTLTASRLAIVMQWKNGQNAKLKVVATWLANKITSVGGMRFELGAGFISNEWLLIRAALLEPALYVAGKVKHIPMQRITWNDFLDLPASIVANILEDHDTINFTQTHPNEFYGEFYNYTKKLAREATYAFVPLDEVKKAYNVNPIYPPPAFAIYK